MVVTRIKGKMIVLVTAQGYGVCFLRDEVPVLSGAGKGVVLQKMPTDDVLVVAASVDKSDKLALQLQGKKTFELAIASMTIGTRAKRGLKVVKRGTPVLGLVPADEKGK